MTQDEALTVLKTGANVFLTGEPGSGKTHTVNGYIAYLRQSGIEPSITASTGIAATHVGGLTVHSWSGIGIRSRLSEYDLDAIASNRRIVERVRNARVLIIDEVSMLSARTLAMVDAVCREVRGLREPFGGLQTVFVGDFFQLPPITRSIGANQAELAFEETDDSSEFAFASASWRDAKPLVCYLSEQHRQEDEAFLGLLSAVRRGMVNETHFSLLADRFCAAPQNGVTQLYSHNVDVDRINAGELTKLKGDGETFRMESYGPDPLTASLKRGCLSPECLEIKMGAKVMFTKNDQKGRFSNGTLGTISSFAKESGFPVVKTMAGRTVEAEPAEWRMEDGGKVLARVIQIPLRLAWAMTVHKSQGLSLDAAHMDLSSAFEYGQGYVALSRVRTLKGLSLKGVNGRALEVHPKVLEKDEELRAASNAAREAFLKLNRDELEKLHGNFLRACGGKKSKSGGGGSAALPRAVHKISTYEATKALVLQGRSLAEMAKSRKLTAGTIIEHLEKLVEEGSLDPHRDLAHLKPSAKSFAKIKTAFEAVHKKTGETLLSPVHTMLRSTVSFDSLRIGRLFLDF